VDIDYLADGAPECPLVRIIGSGPVLGALHRSIERLGSGEEIEIAAHTLDGVQSGISLILRRGLSDGVRQIALSEFVWTLTAEGWADVADLVLPFMQPSDGHAHQWLAGGEARGLRNAAGINVVLTTDGRW
jgi:hypothetical protein